MAPQTPPDEISVPAKTFFNKNHEATTMMAEAAHTPMCKLFSNLLKDAFSSAFTTKTPMSEANTPKPARAKGAIASFKPTPSPREPAPAKAAAAPIAIVARMDP